MPKNILEDIVRHPGPKKKKIPDKINYHKIEKNFIPSSPELKVIHKSTPSGRGKYALWGVALASVVFLFFALSYLFSGAKITINLKVKNIVLDQDFSSIKDSSTDDLPYDLVVI